MGSCTLQPSRATISAEEGRTKLEEHWPPVSLVVGGTLLLSLGAGLLLSGLVRIDTKTAALGALPGAASGMLAMRAWSP